MVIQIYTDGSCLKNGYGGSGIAFPNHEYTHQSIEINDKTTNNEAELLAISMCLQIVENTDNVVIFTDSKYCINCITKWYKNWIINNTLKYKLNTDLIAKIFNKIEERSGTTEFKHVKGQSNDKWNDYADKLATDASARVKAKVT